MSVYFIDLDGTLFKHSTQELLPGAAELLSKIKSEGHQIVLTTRRGDKEWGEDHPIYSKKATYQALRLYRIKYDEIIFDLSSPRIVVNDDGAFGHNHVGNEPWDQKEIDRLVTINKE